MRIGIGAALCVALLWMAPSAHADLVAKYNFEGSNNATRFSNKASPVTGIQVGSLQENVRSFSTYTSGAYSGRSLKTRDSDWSGNFNVNDDRFWAEITVQAGYKATIDHLSLKYKKQNGSSPDKLTVLIYDTDNNTVVKKLFDNTSLTATSWSSKSTSTTVDLGEGNYELRFYPSRASNVDKYLYFDDIKVKAWMMQVPEPASVALAGLALGGIAWRRRRRTRA